MNPSIVQYLSKDSSSCGYCKSSTDNVSYGMWAHTMTVEDYQCLIDRGWRRCGLYCYKPVMKEICCPAYTIKCDALNLKLSKSQKKVLRRVEGFLKRSSCTKEDGLLESHETASDSVAFKTPKPAIKIQPLTACEMEISANFKQEINKSVSHSEISVLNPTNDVVGNMSAEVLPKPGVGEDRSKPKCKKAKLLRMERKIEKQRRKGITELPAKAAPLEKTLEDFISESEEQNGAMKLELTLVPACSDETILQESYLLYKKYQKVIHNDKEDEISFSGFTDFLVSSPLQPYKNDVSPPKGYGSFHMLYRLDGKLIAVGVIDILPRCISSVYFFYDPSYSHLSLGTYSSLRELELTRKYAKTCPDLNQYYLGFYIHTCTKMRYKGKIHPSFLLCPEAYSWHPIETCLSKLENSKYSRLNDEPNAKSSEDETDVDEVGVHNMAVVT